MTYDALGNLLSRTEAEGRPEERTTSYQYDQLGHQIRIIYPPVSVYTGAEDMATNGATGLAVRVEEMQTLSTDTIYDVFGNAIANIDMAGHSSFKTYDLAGRLEYEVDAEGYVTGYERNAFGDVTAMTRYGESLGGAIAGWTTLESWYIENNLHHEGEGPAPQDRVLLTAYDRAGRAIEVREPETYAYDASFGGHPDIHGGKATRNTWNAFGDLVQVAQLRDVYRDGEEVWALTNHYYDHRGQKTATVDAEGYLTTDAYDAAGNVTEHVEYALRAVQRTSPVSLDGWTGNEPLSNIPPAAPGAYPAEDRTTAFTYDLNNRKTSEIRRDVMYTAVWNAALSQQDLATTYGYDAVGNQTRVTDAAGGSTYTYYDALGRIVSVAGPLRAGPTDGSVLTPLTGYRRDAYGNVIAKTEYAYGAGSNGVPAASAPEDHVTYAMYDSFGHVTQRTDALGRNHYSSYNSQGLLAKEWQAVTDGDNATRTLFRAYAYDNLGRQTHIYDPGTASDNADYVNGGAAASGAYHASPAVSVTPATPGGDEGSNPAPTNGTVAMELINVIDASGGAVRVTIDFRTPENEGGDESNPGNLPASETRTFTLAEAMRGISISPETTQIGTVTHYAVYQQDAGGNWVLVWDGAAQDAVGSDNLHLDRDTVGLVDTALRYNAFGELTAKGVNGGWQEYYDYDAAGNLWRTNAGDGVDKVMLYDLMGNQTVEIRSGGAGRGNLDLRAVGSAEEADALTEVRRTETDHNLLGHVIEQRLPERLAQGDAAYQRPVIQQQVDRWGNALSVSDPRNASWVTKYRYNSDNQIIEQIQPDANGYAAWNNPGSPITRIAYDQLGRQVAVIDANGNLNGTVYDAAGNVVEEHHADGGVSGSRYDAFGNKVRTIDEVGNPTWFAYDELDRLVQTTHGDTEVFRGGPNGALINLGHAQITETSTYDQAGRKLSQTNGAGETIRYAYDVRGNLIRTTLPMGEATSSAYDALNRKIIEVDAGGALATWRYDYFGTLTGRDDIGGANYVYEYDHARQLVADANNRGQGHAYQYDAAGQLVRITDNALNQVTQYIYDLGGRHIHESTVQGGVVYQDSTIAYDTLGRMRNVHDAQANTSIDIAYDKVGNRTYIATSVNGSGATQQIARYYHYDAMNRQTLVDGVDDNGTIAAGRGHRITYDQAGNRTSDTSIGTLVTSQQVIDHYGEASDGTPIPVYRTDYTASTGETTEVYGYDALDRLLTVVRDGVTLDIRRYDGASRVVQTGPDGTLAQGYVAALNGTTLSGQTMAGNGTETQSNQYDANGRLATQTVFNSDGSAKYSVNYNRTGLPFNWQEGYDPAGNLLGYTVTSFQGGDSTLTHYGIDTLRADGYKQSVIHGIGTGQIPSDTVFHYDPNGHLTSVTETSNAGSSPYNRSFVNDSSGTALLLDQGGHEQRQIVVNGEVLGRYGLTVNSFNPQNPDGSLNYAAFVDLSFGYQPVSGNFPAASPGTYAVMAGDTLQGVAKGAYGDSSLWYLIAEANGLSGSDTLQVGQVLTIPTRVPSANNSNTFKPYDPSKIIGDTNPHMLALPKDDGWGFLGDLVMVVVAIVVMVYAPYLLPAMPAPLAAAASAALGSIASQGVGMAIGQQEGFSWKQVGMAALSAGVTEGIGGDLVRGIGNFTGSPLVGRVVGSALTNAAIQGISVATGLQDQFSWRGVAAAGVSAGVGQSVKGWAGDVLGTSAAATFTARTLGSIAAGTTALAMRGGRISAAQVAVDAFGNVIGDALASANGQRADPLGDFIGRNQRAWDQRYADAVMSRTLATPSNTTISSDGPTRSKTQQYVDSFGGGAMVTSSMTGGMPYGTSGQLTPDVPFVDLPETDVPTLREVIVHAEPDYDDGSYDASEAARLSNYPAPTSGSGSSSPYGPDWSFLAASRASLDRAYAAQRATWPVAGPIKGPPVRQLTAGEVARANSFGMQAGRSTAQGLVAGAMISPPGLVASTGVAAFGATTNWQQGNYGAAALNAAEIGMNFAGAGVLSKLGKPAALGDSPETALSSLLRNGTVPESLGRTRLSGLAPEVDAAMASTRVDLSSQFTVSRGANGVKVQYGDPNGWEALGGDSHGIIGVVNKEGVLGIDVYANPELRTQYGSGTDMFTSMMTRLQQEGTNVSAIRGAWLQGTDSVNFAQYQTGISNGLAPAQAAANTWTGKLAGQNGYTQVEMLNGQSANIYVLFKKPGG